jgi:hypothetical protein
MPSNPPLMRPGGAITRTGHVARGGTEGVCGRDALVAALRIIITVCLCPRSPPGRACGAVTGS